MKHLLTWLPAGLVFATLQVALKLRDESKLARRLCEHDPSAMSELYDRYGKLAYSIIFRVVRNEAVAEDLVQETFLRVWNRSGSFDAEKGALGPWVLTVARNRAIDHLRSTDGRLSASSVEIDALDRPGLFRGFDDAALSVDRGRRLKAAFERLSPNQKTVIELAYYEGLSQTEMADKMKQPLGTIKTWVRTALQVLREELSEVAA